MRHAVGLLLLSGCQLVFPLDEPVCRVLAAEPACAATDPDEDDDGVADACDSCPQFDTGEIAVPDFDGDGIGDLCDPFPTPPPCSRRFFGMREDDGSWRSTAGWTFDESVGRTTASSTFEVLRSRDSYATGRLETVIVDREPIADAAAPFAAIVMMAQDTSGYFCALQPNGSGGGSLAVGRFNATGEQAVMESPPFMRNEVTPGFVHRLRLSVTRDGVVTCESEGSTTQRPFNFNHPEAMLTFTDPELPPAGDIGIVARDTLDEFDYLDFVPE